MRDTLAAIQLVQADLYRGQELKPIRNLTYRRIIGKLSNGVQDHLFLRHRQTLECGTLFGKPPGGLTGLWDIGLAHPAERRCGIELVE